MLQALGPYLRVSFLFFADMMLTVLMTERFHITFSPFVNTYFNPLATHWYRRYGRFMRHIILEIDMTRLGFGPDRQAYKLRAGNMNLDTLIQMFVDVQLRRQDESTMSSFVLLCRRFYGCRPTVIDHITGLDPCSPDRHNPRPPQAPRLPRHPLPALAAPPRPVLPPGHATGRVHHDNHDADMPPPPRVPPGPIMLPAPHVSSRGVTFLDTPTTSHDSRSTASVRRAARFGVLASKVRERKASVAADIETLERRVQGLVSRLRRRSSRAGLRAMASREGLRQRSRALEHVDAQKARPEWSKEGPPSLELPNFLDDEDHVYGEKTEKVRRVRSKASVPVMSPVRKAAELKYRPSMPELRQKVSKMASWLDLRARKRAGETSEDMDKEIF
ncbi:hypothetical protein VDGE_01204 [Verticillium dahliae]|uniref:Uncharacterized protein n=1 Tax=Verticillium dahliae TaxID=27337 RepID=A0A444RRC3_VERDA|nr:hypothetical protein VDGE_01204 [Verticillium dahliae]